MVANTFQFKSSNKASFSTLTLSTILHTCGFNKQKGSLHSQQSFIVICDSTCAKMSAFQIIETSCPAFTSNLYWSRDCSRLAQLYRVKAVWERLHYWRYRYRRMFSYQDFIMIDMGVVVGVVQLGLYVGYNIVSFQMGPCISSKHAKMASQSPIQFLQQPQNIRGVVQPLPTTLFNLLRKPQQLQIIRYGPNTQKLFQGQTSPNMAALGVKDIKMLYSFKNILFVGQGTYGDMLGKIRAAANPKAVYQVSEDKAREFLGRFRVFADGSPTISTQFIPVFAINSEELVKKGRKREVFIHEAQNEKKQIYKKLDITAVIPDHPTYTIEQSAQELKKHSSSTAVFTYSKQKKQEDLLNILSSFLVLQYGLIPFNAQVYIRRCLPQISLSSQIPTLKQIPTSHTLKPLHSQKSTKSLQQLSLTELYQKHLTQLYQQMNSKQKVTKIERSYNLLSTLINNICNNKGNDSYRKVRKTNKQIDQLLGKYRNGVALLREVGFEESGAEFVNNAEVKYLKIFKTDLDMAYRNFQSHVNS